MTKWLSRCLGAVVTVFILGCSPMRPMSHDSASVKQGSDVATYSKIARGAALYGNHCAGCHAPLNNSTKLNRTVTQIQTARSTVASMSSMSGIAALSNEDIEAIAAALQSGAFANLSNPFVCKQGADPTTHVLQRLTYREYVNTLLDLMAGQVALADLQTELENLPREAVVDHPAVRLYDTTNPAIMSLRLIRSYNSVGARAADVIVASAAKMNALAGDNCISAATVSDACVNGFLDRFALRALRRPPTTAEKSEYLALYRTGANSADRLARVIQALLSSPQFLYHLYDNGTPVSGRADLLELSPYELASKLSYAMTGSMPDASLFTAAANGSLNTSTGLDSQILRLFATSKAKEQIRQFYSQWLRLDRIPNMNVTSEFANGIDPLAFQTEAGQEIADYMDHVIWTTNGNYAQLLTSNIIFPKGAQLARAYGTSMSAQPVASTDPNRKGLFTRAGLLSQSGAGTTDPIKRGVRLRVNILCDNLGAPPANAIESAAPIDPLSSTRTQTTVKTSPTACVGCHGQINPSGFAFENYDAFGRHRVQETVSYNGQSAVWPINARVAPNIDAAGEPEVDGAVAMQEAILKSNKGPACVTKQYLHFQTGRLSAADDSCTLSPMYNALTKSGGSFQEMFKALPKTPDFKLKKIN